VDAGLRTVMAFKTVVGRKPGRSDDPAPSGR